MNKELKITHRFHRTKEDLFNYWVNPKLFEKWAAPEGFTLKVNSMEAKKGGIYSMVHTGPKGENEGPYVCNGYFKEYTPDEKLVQIDTVLGPDGTALFRDLECVVEFKSKLDGTEVTVTQRGFTDEKTRNDCEKGWEDSLTNLDALLNEETFRELETERLTEL